MGDLVFNGGKYGIWVGNQQSVFAFTSLSSCITHDASAHRFTVRNITVNDANTGKVYDACWYIGLISSAPSCIRILELG